MLGCSRNALADGYRQTERECEMRFTLSRGAQLSAAILTVLMTECASLLPARLCSLLTSHACFTRRLTDSRRTASVEGFTVTAALE